MLNYPSSRHADHVDQYHGVAIADPFRWLEDDRSAETAAWVTAQNAVTQEYLNAIPYRESILERLTALANYERISAPEVKGRWHLIARNDGLQNQSAYYLREGEDGEPELLLDPNVLSADGTTRVSSLTFNHAGTRIAYMVSKAGSDWQQIRIIDLETRTDLPDLIEWVKVSSIAWFGQGFFYSRYPAPYEDASALSSSNDDHLVYYHTLGTSQSEDVLTYRDDQHTQRFHHVQTTKNERFAVLYISDRGQGNDGNAMYVRDLHQPESPFRPVWTSFADDLHVLDAHGDKLLVLTNRGAPNRRIVAIDPLHPAESEWVTLVSEQANPIDGASSAGGRLFVSYLQDVTSRTHVFHLDGQPDREIPLPGLGTVSGFDGEANTDAVYFTFTSFTAPPAVYRYEIATGIMACTHRAQVAFDPDQFETRQDFVTSADGTRIPVFIVSRRGLVRHGNNPTLLYGYGGFNVSLPPTFSALRIALLEQGCVYVQANLRGGGEYGEAWHRAGIKEHKQNVFDDAIAVAEWLCAAGYTRPGRLALQGGSNGGLLVGALMTQRPKLAAVALPSVGVLDMLRFHKFTIGWNWVADYGSSDDPTGFRYLHAYSPLHQLRDGVAYPATLITTGDHDDRVVPAHSFKFAARLQEAQGGTAPVLIRVETQSGHGASSLTKSLQETADVYAFLLANLGVTPRDVTGVESGPLETDGAAASHRQTATESVPRG